MKIIFLYFKTIMTGLYLNLVNCLCVFFLFFFFLDYKTIKNWFFIVFKFNLMSIVSFFKMICIKFILLKMIKNAFTFSKDNI